MAPSVHESNSESEAEQVKSGVREVHSDPSDDETSSRAGETSAAAVVTKQDEPEASPTNLPEKSSDDGEVEEKTVEKQEDTVSKEEPEVTKHEAEVTQKEEEEVAKQGEDESDKEEKEEEEKSDTEVKVDEESKEEAVKDVEEKTEEKLPEKDEAASPDVEVINLEESAESVICTILKNFNWNV